MSTFREVQSAYLERLLRSLVVAEERLGIAGLRLTTINGAARARFTSDWMQHDERDVGWDWASDTHRPTKGLNVAMWHGDVLCGLASGKLTSHAVRLDYLEGYPDYHPLRGKIIPTALTCADTYREVVGLTEIRLQDVREELVPIYERYGFQLAPESGRVHVMHRITT